METTAWHGMALSECNLLGLTTRPGNTTDLFVNTSVFKNESLSIVNLMVNLVLTCHSIYIGSSGPVPRFLTSHNILISSLWVDTPQWKGFQMFHYSYRRCSYMTIHNVRGTTSHSNYRRVIISRLLTSSPHRLKVK